MLRAATSSRRLAAFIPDAEIADAVLMTRR
jgi:hypothetical protein